eukprot:SAG31_NODE_65_length_28565_cov_8.402914_34_plen_170_part_00
MFRSGAFSTATELTAGSPTPGSDRGVKAEGGDVATRSPLKNSLCSRKYPFEVGPHDTFTVVPSKNQPLSPHPADALLDDGRCAPAAANRLPLERMLNHIVFLCPALDTGKQYIWGACSVRAECGSLSPWRSDTAVHERVGTACRTVGPKAYNVGAGFGSLQVGGPLDTR